MRDGTSAQKRIHCKSFLKRSWCSFRSLFTSSLLLGTGPAFSKAFFRSWLFSMPKT